MGDPNDASTRVTLLGRLYQEEAPDAEAWREFVVHYGRQIYKWCRHWGLQDADAEDVTQQVLVRLARYMKDFVYDPTRSFRAWLKTVAHNAWLSWVEDQQRTTPGSGDSGQQQQLHTVPAREDLVERLEREFDRELVDQAIALVRLRVAPHNWQAFQLTVLEGVPAAEAAAQLGVKVAHVYAAKSMVQKLLQQETARLEAPTGQE
jgi:RNA polymerase sigma-70 factor (ECF subfamily)